MSNKEVLNDDRYKIGNRITMITIIINVILAFAKVTIGIFSNSTAILADGIHTISDVGSSIGIIVGFFIASKPEDDKHQYGHEKAESIAGFILSILLLSVGIKIGYSAIEIMLSKNSSTPGIVAAWAAGLSILVKEVQFRITMYGGKKINSSALIADAWHHRSDTLSSIAALIGIIGARMGYPILDPIAALIVSVIIVKVAIELFLNGFNELMDSSIEENELNKLIEKIYKNSDIQKINDIKARKHGSKVFVDIEICVDSNITVVTGHSIAEEVEDIVYNTIGNVKKVLIHVEPCLELLCKDCEKCKTANN